MLCCVVLGSALFINVKKKKCVHEADEKNKHIGMVFV